MRSKLASLNTSLPLYYEPDLFRPSTSQWPVWDKRPGDPFEYAWGTELDGDFYLIHIVELYTFGHDPRYVVCVEKLVSENDAEKWQEVIRKEGNSVLTFDLRKLVDEIKARLPEYLVEQVL